MKMFSTVVVLVCAVLLTGNTDAAKVVECTAPTGAAGVVTSINKFGIIEIFASNISGAPQPVKQCTPCFKGAVRGSFSRYYYPGGSNGVYQVMISAGV